MNEQDTKQLDPINLDPGSPRWIFFDDEPPSREEREKRAEAIQAEEEASLDRPLDWVDPRIDDYHQRMEVRRYGKWLCDWYRRNQPDNRTQLLGNMVAAELDAESFISRIRDGLDGKLKAHELESLWSRLSFYKAVKTVLTKPCLPPITKTTPVLRSRRLPVTVVDDYGNEVEAEEVLPYYSLAHETVHPGSQERAAWSAIHSALNGHGNVDHVPRPPKRTLFSNPDGRRILNQTIATRSPIQAKMAFAQNHKLDPDRVMVERVSAKWDRNWLRQHKLSNPGSTVYVVSARKLSNETPSHYFDPNPHFVDRVDRNGEWQREYAWAGSSLHRIPNSKILPPNSHVLSIRDVERAILAGASFYEDEIDEIANEFTSTENLSDERFRSPELPMRAMEQLSEGEQLFYNALVAAQFYDHAEMLLVDFKALNRSDKATLHHIASTLHNTFAPTYERDTELEEALGSEYPIRVQTNLNFTELESALSQANASRVERFLLDLSGYFDETQPDAEAPPAASPGEKM